MSQQFRVLNARLHSFKSTAKNISQLLAKADPEALKSLKELKAMHSSALSSLQGIEQCRLLTHLSVSSNQLCSLSPVLPGTLLYLDVKANRITSLQGIERCPLLIRLQASHNQLGSVRGLGKVHSKLEFVNVAGNRLEDTQEIRVFGDLKELKELILERGKATNPICSNKQQYYGAVKMYLPKIEKLDELDAMGVKAVLEKDQRQHQRQNYGQHDRQHYRQDQTQHYRQDQMYRTSAKQGRQRMNTTDGYNMVARTNELTQMRVRQMEEVVAFKEDVISEYKIKNTQLEVTNAQYCRELMKRENQLERLHGQLTQMGRNLDQKDQNISELHRRVQDSMKTNASLLKAMQTKGEELQKCNKQMNDMRVQSAQFRVVNRQQQRRLSQLQSKALQTMEQKTVKGEQMRRKYEQACGLTRTAVEERDELRERVRELTQLLREWEFKYESKMRELEGVHHEQKTEIIRQMEEKIRETQTLYSQQMQAIYGQTADRVAQMEAQYSTAIEQLKTKESNQKKAIEERGKHEQELKIALKTVMEKNIAQEGLIKEFQDLLIRLKREMGENTRERDQLRNQCVLLRNNFQDVSKNLHSQLARMTSERNSLDKQLKDVRGDASKTEALIQRADQKERECAQLQQKVESLNATLQAKNVMLDDKNDTIETIKAELDTLQREIARKVDGEEHEALQRKYAKGKEKNKELTKQIQTLAEENEQLYTQKEATEALQKEFGEIREMLGQQSSLLQEKDKQINELVGLLSECKRVDGVQKEQLQQRRREVGRLATEMAEKERRLWRQKEQLQLGFERKIKDLEAERENYKKIVAQLKDIEALTKNLSS